jgi:alkanesulfonate monooxygenase SsuD/methylene tetrahydromethanopterin reductase-like flavin-dependent oxidoreductase (luciferase family)
VRRANGEMNEIRPLHPWVVERRDSIHFGLQAIARPDDPEPGAAEIAAGILAEQLGFDAFFLGDHPAWAPDCWLHLAALAMRTERIGLGPLVSCILYRPPVMTARLAADLDRLSGGRLVLGLGIGWDASELGWGTNEFDRLGLSYPPTRERQAALDEAITILNQVWGPVPINFSGTHFTATDVQVFPPPLQRYGPPVVIAGAGTRTLRQVARSADMCNFGPVVTGGVDSPEETAGRLAILRSHCEEIGRPYENILRSHYTIWLILAETDEALRRKVTRYFPDGMDDTWQKAVFAGTPAEAVQHFQRYANAGMQYFVAQVLDARDDETIRLLAKEVAPNVRAPRA